MKHQGTWLTKVLAMCVIGLGALWGARFPIAQYYTLMLSLYLLITLMGVGYLVHLRKLASTLPNKRDNLKRITHSLGLLFIWASLSLLMLSELSTQTLYNPRLQKVPLLEIFELLTRNGFLSFFCPWLIYFFLAGVWSQAMGRESYPWLPGFLLPRARHQPYVFLRNALIGMHTFAIYGFLILMMTLVMIRSLNGLALMLAWQAPSQQSSLMFLLSVIVPFIVRVKSLRSKPIVRYDFIKSATLYLLALIFSFSFVFRVMLELIDHKNMSPVPLSAYFGVMNGQVLAVRIQLFWASWWLLLAPIVAAQLARVNIGDSFTRFMLKGLVCGSISYLSFSWLGHTPMALKYLSFGLMQPYAQIMTSLLVLALLFYALRDVCGFSDLLKLGLNTKADWPHAPLTKMWRPFWRFFSIHLAGIYLFGMWIDQILMGILNMYLCVAFIAVIFKVLRVPSVRFAVEVSPKHQS